MLYVGWMDGLVIIAHRSCKSTFGANNQWLRKKASPSPRPRPRPKTTTENVITPCKLGSCQRCMITIPCNLPPEVIQSYWQCDIKALWAGYWHIKECALRPDVIDHSAKGGLSQKKIANRIVGPKIITKIVPKWVKYSWGHDLGALDLA